MAINPNCKKCAGSGEVRSWGTSYTHAPCPKCFPDADVKPVTLSEYQAQQAAGDNVRPLQGVSAPPAVPVETVDAIIKDAAAAMSIPPELTRRPTETAMREILSSPPVLKEAGENMAREFQLRVAAHIAVPAPVNQLPDVRQGYRFFGCHECGRAWRTACRDASSPSKETCLCGNDEAPEHYEVDPSIPVDDLGNLVNPAEQEEMAKAVEPSPYHPGDPSGGHAGANSPVVGVDMAADEPAKTVITIRDGAGNLEVLPVSDGEVSGVLSRLKEEPSRSRISDEVLEGIRKADEAKACPHCSKTTRACGAVSSKKTRCTRQDGHSGDHVACGKDERNTKHEIEIWNN